MHGRKRPPASKPKGLLDFSPGFAKPWEHPDRTCRNPERVASRAALKPRVGRYTGQGDQDEKKIANNPPDILLTNFVMAELWLTRQDDVDSTVIHNASGLEFIVLDELHTYRGRQGADVAVLVRRLRNRCTPGKTPICIGTSATMASEGSGESKAQAVADVASRFFGVTLPPFTRLSGVIAGSAARRRCKSGKRASQPHRP